MSLEQRLTILRDFTVLQLDRAVDMAEGGDKDTAREWVKYFENSRVIELLSDDEHGVLSACERNRLLKQLAKLRTECHPADLHDYKSDLAAIRGELSRITKHLGLSESSEFSASLDDKIIQFPGVERPASGS
jgi:hypothetical protein